MASCGPDVDENAAYFGREDIGNEEHGRVDVDVDGLMIRQIVERAVELIDGIGVLDRGQNAQVGVECESGEIPAEAIDFAHGIVFVDEDGCGGLFEI